MAVRRSVRACENAGEMYVHVESAETEYSSRSLARLTQHLVCQLFTCQIETQTPDSEIFSISQLFLQDINNM